MDLEFLKRNLIPVSQKHKYYFNEIGVLILIMNRYDDYLTENEICEYILAMPQIYDQLACCSYNELLDSNITLGRYIREIFGMYHPNNPHIVYNEDIGNQLSPEIMSFRISKFVWMLAQQKPLIKGTTL